MSRKFVIRDPLALHREGVIKSRGLNTWKDNVSVTKYIAEVLKPCLGPKGMLKLVLDKFDETAITSDGAIILEKMDLHHPVAKVLREVAKTVEDFVGDGTKTTIILVGELLKRAEGLIAHKIKVNKIIDGYMLAYSIALKRLREISIAFNILDKKILRNLISTLFMSRGVDHAEYLTELTSQSILNAIKERDGKIILERDAVKIVKKLGESIRDSRLIDGVIIDKKIAHPSMPRAVKNGKIAVLNMALKIDEFRHLQPYKYQIDIKAPHLINQFLEEEENIAREMVNKILSVGANVVVCRKRIGKIAKQLLAEAGVLGISRLLNEEAFTTVAKITGANIVSDLNDLREEDLGRAKIIKEEKIGEDRVIVFEGCGDRGGVTLLLRAGSERILDETEHAIKDALRCISSLLEDPAYLPGGGAVEEALAVAIRNESLKYSGKEQIAMHAFANSLETIPILLVRNSGYDPTDLITELRSKHVDGHSRYGFDAYSGRIVDTFELGIIESYKVKEQVLKTSFEVATMLLRVDEVVDRRYAKRHEGELGGQ
ncbi:MAG: thermosome subunit [Aigarchaeota archaeon]|nr:thermosome subunit [Aigarchaeota archaeon]MCX8193230.1 thermosome subunit [Nitrososphaeria archaeon]MDW7986371.1 thermosome subunit beta [Nitrososphaerota archaeon]